MSQESLNCHFSTVGRAWWRHMASDWHLEKVLMKISERIIIRRRKVFREVIYIQAIGRSYSQEINKLRIL